MRLKAWMLGFILLITSQVLAQNVRVLEFRGGTLNPKGTPSGGIFGASYGTAVDERVDLTFGVDVFHKGYTKESKVASETTDSNIDVDQIITELEYKTTLIPISAGAVVRIPFAKPINWYIGGNLAYQFLISNETNYELDKKKKRVFGGFGWNARAGVEYVIGSKSTLIGELYYNGGKVKRNEDKTEEGFPIRDEVDVSGFGIRAGLRVDLY